MELTEDKLCRIKQIYHDYVLEACDVQDINRWASKKTVSKAILAAETDPNARANELKPWLAIKGKNLQEGDKFYVYMYQDGEKPVVKKGVTQTYKDGSVKTEPNYMLKCVEDYDNDHLELKLAERCYKTLEIFKSVLDMKDYVKYYQSSQASKLDELRRSL